MSWKTETYAGWGRALTATSQMARPERVSTAIAVMSSQPAPGIGNCRSYGDACLNDGGRAVAMGRLDRIIAFDPANGVLHVEGGVAISDLVELFAPMGWLPPVMPGTGFATVGGCIAHDVHGKNHHIHGSFGEHVLEIDLATPAGRKSVSPKRNAAMFRATIGGLGQTGLILSAKLKMRACKGDVMIVTERRVTDLEEHLDLLDRSEATYTVGWIDATARDADVGRGVVEEGETGAGLVRNPGRRRKVPMDAPAFALSGPIVRAFNAAYLRRVPKSGRTSVKPIADFFFPLDKIHDWNRLYGKSGFHQFQCVVPLNARPNLREMLERIGASGLASPLAVLKRMGPGRAGQMSFPMEGYTLAVDFPNRGMASRTIEDLNAMTAAAQGRIYFAKDSLCTPELAAEMYPDRAAWAKQVNKVDPDGVLQTDLVRRLRLREPT